MTRSLLNSKFWKYISVITRNCVLDQNTIVYFNMCELTWVSWVKVKNTDSLIYHIMWVCKFKMIYFSKNQLPKVFSTVSISAVLLLRTKINGLYGCEPRCNKNKYKEFSQPSITGGIVFCDLLTEFFLHIIQIIFFVLLYHYFCAVIIFVLYYQNLHFVLS